MATNRILQTSDGIHSDSFRPVEWALVGSTSLIWGASFLFIAVALDSLPAGVIAFGRVLLGAGTLLLFRSAWRVINRADMPRLVAVGLIGIGAPALLFALAEQTVDSAVVGMLVAGVPILTAAVHTSMTRRLPGRPQQVGLLLGFVGIVLLVMPGLAGAQATPLGILYVLLAILGYAISNNLYVPLAHEYGAAAVQLWGQIAAGAALLPLGLMALPDAEWELLPVLALVALGVLGTGVARVMHVDLVRRVGASRGTIAAYLIPIVALLLGVALRDDEVAPIQIAGMVLALAGGWWLSRAERRPVRETVSSRT